MGTEDWKLNAAQVGRQRNKTTTTTDGEPAAAAAAEAGDVLDNL